jgi:hypothetical protein
MSLLQATVTNTILAVAIAIERDEKKHWLRATATGVLTLDELVTFIRTARTSAELRMWPMIFNGDDATTDMKDEDVDRVVDIVQQAIAMTGMRAHVAVATRDDRLFRWMLLYEERCAEKGARFMRAFRQHPDAERWLEIVSDARNFQ